MAPASCCILLFRVILTKRPLRSVSVCPRAWERRGFRNGPAAGAPQRHSWTSRRNLRVLANPPPVTIAAETPSSYIPRTRSNQISTLKLSQSSEAPCRAVCWYRWSLSPLSQLHSVSGHLVPMTLRRPAACLSTTPYNLSKQVHKAARDSIAGTCADIIMCTCSLQ